MTALTLVHIVHILLGAIWAGGSIALSLLVLPVLARMPADQAAPLFERLVRPAASLLGAAAGLTYLIGIFRGWLGGGISAWSDLLASYGLTVIAAVLVMGAIESTGGAVRRRFRKRLQAPEDHAAKAPADALRAGMIQLVLLAVLIGLMVAMGLGYV